MLLDKGGMIAPPTIDIIIKLEADLVSDSVSRIPIAKIVGNIIDIKKVVPTKAYKVAMPDPKMTIKVNRAAKMLYSINSLYASTKRIKKVPTKRPIINKSPANAP